MKTIFLPSNEANTAKIPGQDVAMIIAEPDAMKDAPIGTKWPVMFFLHGRDNLGGGTLSSLQTYWEGPYSGIAEDWKKAVDKYGIIGVALHYGGSLFSYTQWLWAYAFIMGRYNCYPLVMDQGFSWGAGSEQKCYTTQPGYCNKQAVIMQIAPTIEQNTDAGWAMVASYKVPVWVVVNKGDNVTGTAAAKNTVNYINAKNPLIKATYTELNQNGHGGRNEALGLTPMPGFTENVYELFMDILKNGPRAPKAGGIVSPPPPDPVPTTELKAVATYSGTLPNIKLDGTKSTGYKSATWTVKQVPAGVNIYSSIVKSGGWITSDAVLPKEGEYVIELEVKGADGNVARTELTINYGAITQPAPKPINFIWPDKLVLSDNTTIIVTPSFKAADGTTY